VTNPFLRAAESACEAVEGLGAGSPAAGRDRQSGRDLTPSPVSSYASGVVTPTKEPPLYIHVPTASQLSRLFVPPKLLRDADQAVCMRIPAITDLQIDRCEPCIQEHTDVWSGLPLQVRSSSTPYRPASAY
jgi:hypothetical protein